MSCGSPGWRLEANDRRAVRDKSLIAAVMLARLLVAMDLMKGEVTEALDVVRQGAACEERLNHFLSNTCFVGVEMACFSDFSSDTHKEQQHADVLPFSTLALHSISTWTVFLRPEAMLFAVPTSNHGFEPTTGQPACHWRPSGFWITVKPLDRPFSFSSAVFEVLQLPSRALPSSRVPFGVPSSSIRVPDSSNSLYSAARG
uniref:Uncharacterized protein n=1 Tax=Panagrellus redivivus TaxID=6233 RepID=A0A7E4VC96_PANRE